MTFLRFHFLLLSALLLGSVALRAYGGAAELPAEFGGAYSVPVKSMKDMLAEIRFRTTIRQKFDFSCGSAAVATLLTHHYQRPVSEEDVIKVMYAKGDQAKIQREGFSLLDMKLYLESVGFQADGFEATVDQIVKFGAPGILLVQDNGYKHFVVMKGVQNGKVLLGDPALGSRIMAREEFEKIWVSHIFFVVHNNRELAQFNVPSHWYVRPVAFLSDAIGRDSLAAITLLRPDPATDF
jgi:uncharacterized protein